MSARRQTVTQRRRQAVLSAAALVVIGLVVVATWLINGSSDNSTSTPTARPGASSAAAASTSVPPRVTKTLARIDAGTWPPADAPGTKGGTNFGNYEGRLPTKAASGKRITYTEWDVNRREPGRSRDAERIVTGSDGSAWYTADHYNTFVRIRGPNP